MNRVTGKGRSAVAIDLGALAPSIGEQLRAAGFSAPEQRIEGWERVLDAIRALYLHGYLPDAQAQKLRSRLVRDINQRSTREVDHASR